MTATSAGAADPVAAYLEALFSRARPSTLIEVRWRVPGGMRQRFTPAGARGVLVPVITEPAQTGDVYVGVLPRWRPAGGRAAVVGDCRTVWVDLDSATGLRALEPVDPAPSVVVASGAPGHIHAYWSLRTAVPPRAVERANRRLAWALGGDLASADAARILRPPNTVNHGHGHAPVSLVDRGPTAMCRLGTLIGGLADPPGSPPSRTNRRHARRANADPLLALAPERYVHALTGQRPGRNRKVRCLFHDDRSPSLHVYREPERGWYCFGCGRGGSIYDLAALLSGRATRGPDFASIRRELEDLMLPRRLLARDEGASHVGFARGPSTRRDAAAIA